MFNRLCTIYLFAEAPQLQLIKAMRDECTWAVREVMREVGKEGRVLEASAW